MSDRLDIVRLIDAKVTSTRRTVTRSKQLAGAARDELRIHEDWIRQHNERFEGDLRRHQRRVKRRERLESNKRFAVSALLFLPRLCLRLYRGLASVLRKTDDLLLAGCAWVSRTAHGSGRALVGFVADNGRWIGAKAVTFGLVIAAALWLVFRWLGNRALAAARTVMRAATRGLSWLGPNALRLGHWLFAVVSLALSRLAAGIGGFGRRLHGASKRQGSRPVSRPRPKGEAPERKGSADPDPSRLQQAIFIRLRAEHDRLQARIHAMDRHYQQRVSHLGRNADAREWIELRELARNARRLFEAQQQQVLNQTTSQGMDATPSLPAETRRPLLPHTNPLRTGHAFYERRGLSKGDRRA